MFTHLFILFFQRSSFLSTDHYVLNYLVLFNEIMIRNSSTIYSVYISERKFINISVILFLLYICSLLHYDRQGVLIIANRPYTSIPFYFSSVFV